MSEVDYLKREVERYKQQAKAWEERAGVWQERANSALRMKSPKVNIPEVVTMTLLLILVPWTVVCCGHGWSWLWTR